MLNESHYIKKFVTPPCQHLLFEEIHAEKKKAVKTYLGNLIRKVLKEKL